MSGDSTRSMTFQATPPEVYSALLEAAQRTGFQYLSGDVRTGTAMFTSGKFLLMLGDKITARWEQVAPGTVRVTLSPAAFGIGLRRPSGGPSADRLANELSGLLPHTE
jgi:hypothetical protein